MWHVYVLVEARRGRQLYGAGFMGGYKLPGWMLRSELEFPEEHQAVSVTDPSPHIYRFLCLCLVRCEICLGFASVK